MRSCQRFEIKHLIVIASLVIYSIWFLTESAKPQSCTIFTAAQGETVLFGDNFDYHEADLVIGFFPDSAAEYGSVHFGFRRSDGSINFERAVNSQGLAWAVNSIPHAKLNPHPEKTYSSVEDNYFDTINKRASTVEEAIRIAQKYDFGDSLVVQIHIADASGDAVVIGPSPDGEIAFTRKPVGEGFLLSTNFNLAIPDKGPKDFRYDTGTAMLEKLSTSQALTPEYAGEILNAVRLNNLTTYTLHSNVLDLKNGYIYIYYMSQYDEVVHLDISEELAKGERIIEARELFSPETADAGDAAYRRFETRFTATKITVILAILALIGGGITLVIKKVKRNRA
jgi:hypothetical protein